MGDTVSQQPKLIVSEEQAIRVLKIQLRTNNRRLPFKGETALQKH